MALVLRRHVHLQPPLSYLLCQYYAILGFLQSPHPDRVQKSAAATLIPVACPAFLSPCVTLAKNECAYCAQQSLSLSLFSGTTGTTMGERPFTEVMLGFEVVSGDDGSEVSVG